MSVLGEQVKVGNSGAAIREVKGKSVFFMARYIRRAIITKTAAV